MPTPRFIFVPVWLAFMAAAPAQYFYPKKDVVFAQVVVGGGFETVINLTWQGSRDHSDRAESEYSGTLTFFRLDNAVWNPVVNGRAVENGEYRIRFRGGRTVTLRLTGSELESGAAGLLSDDLLLDNLIEANLTYRVSEDGQVSDSVGVAPSKEFYWAVLPFEQFSEVALALVNGDASGDVTAEVDLILFSAAGEKLQTAPVTLGPRSHRAQFLHEFFPGQTLEGGKVEIASDALIFGSALTLTGGEFSSLPLEPAVTYYRVELVSEDRIATGALVLWPEGSFLRGYLAILRSGTISAGVGVFGDSEFSLVNGELEHGRLRLAFTILHDPFFAQEAVLFLGHDEFSFRTPDENWWLDTEWTGEWTAVLQDGTILKGTYKFREELGREYDGS